MRRRFIEIVLPPRAHQLPHQRFDPFWPAAFTATAAITAIALVTTVALLRDRDAAIVASAIAAVAALGGAAYGRWRR